MIGIACTFLLFVISVAGLGCGGEATLKSGIDAQYHYILEDDLTLIAFDDNWQLLDFVHIQEDSDIEWVKFIRPVESEEIRVVSLGANLLPNWPPQRYFMGKAHPGHGCVVAEIDKGTLVNMTGNGFGMSSPINNEVLELIHVNRVEANYTRSTNTIISLKREAPASLDRQLTAQEFANVFSAVMPKLKLTESSWTRRNDGKATLVGSINEDDVKVLINVNFTESRDNLANYVLVTLQVVDGVDGIDIPEECESTFQRCVLGMLSTAFGSNAVAIIDYLQPDLEKGLTECSTTASSSCHVPPYIMDVSVYDNVSPWGEGEWKLEIRHEAYSH